MHKQDFGKVQFSLTSNFPVASISLWKETMFSPNHKQFYEKIDSLSPSLLLGVVGCHDQESCEASIEKLKGDDYQEKIIQIMLHKRGVGTNL